MTEEKTTEEDHFNDGEDASDEGLDRRGWIVLSNHFYVRIMCSNKLRELIKHISIPRERDRQRCFVCRARISFVLTLSYGRREI